MSNQAKLVRGQLRQIVKEMLPDLLTSELRSAMHDRIAKEVQTRLDNVTKDVKDTLNMLDERSKDIQSYLVRATTQPAAPKEVSLEPKAE